MQKQKFLPELDLPYSQEVYSHSQYSVEKYKFHCYTYQIKILTWVGTEVLPSLFTFLSCYYQINLQTYCFVLKHKNSHLASDWCYRKLIHTTGPLSYQIDVLITLYM